ncbi:hypothetical protein QYF61_020982 [Mycteria americana]|uniref:Uncharacterized protein n=1 Tax=Mycteria americana TaxID=33587 RepID=A0AAN7S0F2_MYCAM|nr:hypothetical protein QYF61_020982 [Mycteria americana]
MILKVFSNLYDSVILWETEPKGTNKGEGKAIGKRWAGACSKRLPRSCSQQLEEPPWPCWSWAPAAPVAWGAATELGVTTPVGEANPWGAETEGFGVNPELCHLMVTAAKAAFNLRISNEPFLVCESEIQQSTSPHWLLYHLGQEVVIDSLQELP